MQQQQQQFNPQAFMPQQQQPFMPQQQQQQAPLMIPQAPPMHQPVPDDFMQQQPDFMRQQQQLPPVPKSILKSSAPPSSGLGLLPVPTQAEPPQFNVNPMMQQQQAMVSEKKCLLKF